MAVLVQKYYFSAQGKTVSLPLSSESHYALNPVERRRSQRIHVQIPMFVRGTDPAGLEFLDLTKTSISATGAYLASPRAMRANQVVNLTIPAPPSPASTVPSDTPPIRARAPPSRYGWDPFAGWSSLRHWINCRNRCRANCGTGVSRRYARICILLPGVPDGR